MSVIMLIPTGSAVSAETNCQQCNQSPVSDSYFTKQGIKVERYTEETGDNNLNLAIEIAESQLEEKAIITNDGHVKNYFRNHKKAEVSKEAYRKFESMIIEINKQVDAGQVTLGKSLLDMEVNENGLITTASSNFISHSKAVKAQKLLAAGAGVSLLAAELGLPVVVASGLAAIAGIIGACDWNDKGFYLIKVKVWTCAPAA
jgi:hypothetical protein